MLSSTTIGYTCCTLYKYLLVFISFPLLNISRVKPNLLVVLLQSCHVFPSLRKLTLLHTLANIPVDKGTLSIHQVELMIQPCPSLSNCSSVGEHADCPLHLGQVSPRNHGGRLVVDANLEACGTPVHKLDTPLALDGGDSSVDILGHNVATVEHAAGHVLAMPGIAFHHGVGWFEAGIGNFCNAQRFVVGFLCRDDGSIGHQRKVNPWIWDQISLELIQVHIESSVKAEGGSDGGDNLADQPVEVGVARPLDVQIPPADIVDSLVINHEGAVAVLQCGVRTEGGVIRFHHSSGNLGSWVDAELKLGLLAVVHRQAFHQERGEARASATTK